MVAPIGVPTLRTALTHIHMNAMNEATATVPLVGDEINLTSADEVRFWSKVDKVNGPIPDQTNPHYAGLEKCWTWTDSKNRNGYGQFTVRGRMFRPHRLAWILAHGPIPKSDDNYHGLCVMHRCDNPACVRPDHFVLGTHTDNMRDKERKGRGNQPCGDANGQRKHPESRARGESRGLAKLTNSDAVMIRVLYATGRFSHRSLAAQFGVSHVVIGGVVRRDLWSHIPDDWI